VNAAQAKADQDVANQQSNVDAAQSTFDTDNAKLTAAQAALAAAQGTPGQATAQAAADQATATVAKDQAALTAAKNQLASLRLSSQQSVTNANNAVTTAQNQRDSKLAADQQAIDNANRQLTSQNAAYANTVAGIDAKTAAPTDIDLAQPKAQLLSAQNALATAQKNVASATLKAPIDGTITVLNGQVGSAASSSAGSSGSSGASGSSSSSSSTSAFLTIVDFSHLQVKVGFSESDATRLVLGQAAAITFDSITGASFTGKLTSIDQTATTVSNVVTFYTLIDIDASAANAKIKPGMTANVVVTVEHADDVVFLPTAAVTARGNSATVNVQTGPKVTDTAPKQITIGLRGDQAIEIKSGLAAGDKVVVVRQASTTGVGTNGGRVGGTGTVGAGGGVVVPGGGGPPPGAGGARPGG
jgi:membrane fusion protein, macrolide-specific efflux system